MDAQILEGSYQRVFGPELGLSDEAEQFFESFYNLFVLEPYVARHFERTDMTNQVSMMKRSFFKLLGYHLTHEWSPELDALAKRHHELGIDPAMYDHWLSCFLKTVDQWDAEATAETLLAWRLALTPGVVFMKHWGEVYAIQQDSTGGVH